MRGMGELSTYDQNADPRGSKISHWFDHGAGKSKSQTSVVILRKING